MRMDESAHKIIDRLHMQQVRWRKTNPLFQTFPWSCSSVTNGKYNALSELLDEHAKSNKSAHTLLCLAATLDANEKTVYDDQRKVTPLFSLLNLIPKQGDLSNNDGNYVSSVIFGYKLFDTLLEHTGITHAASDVIVPRSAYPSGVTDSFKEKILNKLSSWPSVVKNAISVYKEEHAINASAAEFLPNSPSPSQTQLARRLETMMKVSARISNIKSEKIIRNLESAVIMAQWLLAGNLDMPRTLDDCFKSLIESARIVNIHITQDWLRRNMGNIQPATLRSPLQYALAISPLVLLLPLDISKHGISREVLVKICISLGNQRPSPLRAVEQSLWGLIFHAVQGASLMEELDKFSQRYKGIFGAATDGENFEPSWFTEGYRPTDVDLTPTPTSPQTQAHITDEMDVDPAQKRKRSHSPVTPMPSKKAKCRANGGPADGHIDPPQPNDDTSGDPEPGESSRMVLRVRRPVVVLAQITSTQPRRAVHAKSLRVGSRIEPIAVTPGPPTPSNFKDVPPQKRAETGPALTIQGLHPSSSPVNHVFKTYEHLADFDHPLVQDAQAVVEEFFVNGKPRHHQDSARCVYFDPDDSNNSCVFICTHEDFQRLSPLQIQHIFCHRHIVVTGVQHQAEVDFSSRGLSKLGYLNCGREIQVQSLRTKETPMECLRVATFKDILHESEKGDQGHIMNALDIPYACSEFVPPRFGDISTDTAAWQRTLFHPGFVSCDPPSSVTIWSAVATRNAYTGCHMDTDGFGTVVTQATGLKYWLVASDVPRSGKSPEKFKGDMRSIGALGPEYSPSTSGRGYFRWEGLLLTPGTTLYMRPNTIHFAVTVENSIMLGRHFMSLATAIDTCLGMVHCFVVSYITNASQLGASRRMLRRMFAYWMDSLEFEEDTSDEHVPNLCDWDQFASMLAVSNTLALSEFLDPRYYQRNMPEREKIEINTGRVMREGFKQHVRDRYIASTAGNEDVNAINLIFNNSLAQVAACVYRYKKQQASDFVEVMGRKSSGDAFYVSPNAVNEAFQDFLDLETLVPYQALVDGSHLHLPFDLDFKYDFKKRSGGLQKSFSSDTQEGVNWTIPSGPKGTYREFTEKELARLRSPSAMLDDVCINSSAKLLARFVNTPASDRCALFSTYVCTGDQSSDNLWRRVANVLYWNKPIWVIPIHVKQTEHWVLCTLYTETREIYLFDSSCIVSQRAWKTIVKNVMDLLDRLASLAYTKGHRCTLTSADKWTSHQLLDRAVQHNGYDCGVWVLAQIFAILRGFQLTGITLVEDFRSRLVQLAENHPTQ